MANEFDFYTAQADVQEYYNPKELFAFWDEICRMYTSGYVKKWQYDELKDLVFKRFKELRPVVQAIEDASKVVAIVLILFFSTIGDASATTIAWDGNNFACDSQITCDSIKEQAATCKITWINGDLVGAAGEVRQIQLFKRWYANQSRPYPKLDDEFNALVLTPRGAFIYDNKLPRRLVKAPYAIGSGKQIALGAMKAGVTAFKAVDIATETDLYTGKPVRVFPYECR